MSNKGIRAIAESLKNNNSLIKLDLDKNNIRGQSFKIAINEYLQRNKSLAEEKAQTLLENYNETIDYQNIIYNIDILGEKNILE